MVDLRVGTGLDVHPLVEGRPLILGGVRIPHPSGLAGDSDADALMHAVSDALLGAAGLGDLGAHFPRGAGADHAAPAAPAAPRTGSRRLDSGRILAHVAALVRESGYSVLNVDATVVAQRPRLAPHAARMSVNLALRLAIPADRVNVKAKSTDHLGFLGRGEGIAALATVLLSRAAPALASRKRRRR